MRAGGGGDSFHAPPGLRLAAFLRVVFFFAAGRLAVARFFAAAFLVAFFFAVRAEERAAVFFLETRRFFFGLGVGAGRAQSPPGDQLSQAERVLPGGTVIAAVVNPAVVTTFESLPAGSVWTRWA